MASCVRTCVGSGEEGPGWEGQGNVTTTASTSATPRVGVSSGNHRLARHELEILDSLLLPQYRSHFSPHKHQQAIAPQLQSTGKVGAEREWKHSAPYCAFRDFPDVDKTLRIMSWLGDRGAQGKLLVALLQITTVGKSLKVEVIFDSIYLELSWSLPSGARSTNVAARYSDRMCTFGVEKVLNLVTWPGG
ncbi:hypothetical protein TSMEX_004856 [Taenia solium]|eukprot:TsM_001228600 transcript=TsM_001228600 gene=TsM_001228600